MASYRISAVCLDSFCVPNGYYSNSQYKSIDGTGSDWPRFVRGRAEMASSGGFKLSVMFHFSFVFLADLVLSPRRRWRPSR
jgi:hypothetical protein